MATDLYGLLGVEDPRKQEALRMGLLQGGLGILANAYSPYGGGGLAAIGRGGLMGVDAYQQALQQQQQQEFQNFRIEQAKQEFNLKRAEADRLRVERENEEKEIAKLPEGERGLARILGKKYWESTLPERQKQTQLAQYLEAAGIPRDQWPAYFARLAEKTVSPRAGVTVNFGQPIPVFDPVTSTNKLVQVSPTGEVLDVGLSPPEKLTETESDAAAKFQEMNFAESKLSELGQTKLGLGERLQVKAAESGVLKPFTSDQAQQIENAQRSWARQKIYFDTGKAATSREEDSTIKTYMPQPGDSAAVVRQKAELRRNAMQAARLKIGPSGEIRLKRLDSERKGGKSKETLTPEEIEAEMKKRGLLNAR